MCSADQVEVAVVIPTRNGRGRILECLRALDEQYLPPIEVIVVDDGSTDGTGASVAEYRPRRYRFQALRQNPAGPAAARNRGIAAAVAPVIAFTDDDCIPSPGWILGLISALKGYPEAVAVFGRTVPSGVVSPLMHYPTNEGEGHQTCNAAYRREVLEQLGGFDERFPYPFLEDTDLYYRAAKLGPTVFAAEALVVHPARPQTVLGYARKARYLSAHFILHHRHPAAYRARRRGAGPLRYLLYYVALKHGIAAAFRERRWMIVRPLEYLRFVAALLAESAYLAFLLLTGRLVADAARALCSDASGSGGRTVTLCEPRGQSPGAG